MEIYHGYRRFNLKLGSHPMRSFILTVALTVFLWSINTLAEPLSSVSQGKKTKLLTQLNSDEAKVSYSIGVDLGQNFKDQGIVVDPKILLSGLQDGIQGRSLLTREQMGQVLTNLRKALIAKKEAQKKELSVKNKKLSTVFLEKNRTQTGVITTASGLQYKVIQEGQGKSPGEQDFVTVDYKGTFVDGKVFDQSKQPITFPVSGVIPGWVEVLKLMKPGATYQAFLPPKLAYGENGFEPMIEPNQTLVFTIHLIKIKDQDKVAADKATDKKVG